MSDEAATKDSFASKNIKDLRYANTEEEVIVSNGHDEKREREDNEAPGVDHKDDVE